MEIPLFPLHQVLCPGIVLPLHIFEDRYQAMTRHCLDTGQPFGVVLIRDGREVGTKGVATLAGVGAFAEIREAGRYPDGRYDLLAAATGRFAIDSVDAQREPYLVADVTPLDDEVGDEARAERLAAKAIRRFVRYLDLMRAREGESSEVLDIRVEIEATVGEPDPEADPMATAEPELTPESDPPTRRDLDIPDDPTVLSYLLSGHRPGRAAAPSGAARGGDDGRTARGPDRPPRARGRAAQPAAPLLHARPGDHRRRPPELVPGRVTDRLTSSLQVT